MGEATASGERLARLTVGLAILATLGTIGVFLAIADASLIAKITAIVFGVAAGLPYASLAALAWGLRSRAIGPAILAFGVLGCGGFAASLFHRHFFVEPGVGSPLLVAAVPIYQTAGVVVFVLLALAAHYVAKRSG